MGRRHDDDDDEDDYEDDRGPRRRRPRFSCPFCGSGVPPDTVKKITTTGWVLFAVFIFVLPFNCFFLLIRDERRVCRDCGMKLS